MVNTSRTIERRNSTSSYWCMSFAGVPASIPEVRRYLVNVLGSCEIEPLIVVTELATNAIKHTASGGVGGQFVLHVNRDSTQLRIRVDDQGGPQAPRIVSSDDAQDTGRGLALVEKLSLCWGVDGDEQSRMVWAALVLSSDQPEVARPENTASAMENGGLPP